VLCHILFPAILSNIANEELQVKNCKSRIASQVLICKSSQELQKMSLDSLDADWKFNEWKNFQSCYFYFFTVIFWRIDAEHDGRRNL
jgi:hypothetical protein